MAELEADIEQRGLRPRTEYRVDTPNGHKKRRFVDVVGLAGDTPLEMHQVGKQTQKGTPVRREIRALDDIEGAKGVRPNFHPYNN